MPELPRVSPEHQERMMVRALVAKHPLQFATHGSMCLLAIDAAARGLFDLAKVYAASAHRIDAEFFGGYFQRAAA